MWLLDTNAIIHAQRGEPPGFGQRLARTSPDDVVISAVTIAELWHGAAKHPDPERKRRLWLRVLEPFVVLPFDRAAAEVHGDLRYELRHSPIGERDLLLASIGLARGLTLVTANLREFRRVPGLNVEDWGE